MCYQRILRSVFAISFLGLWVSLCAQVNQWPAGLSLTDPIVQEGLADAPEDVNTCGTGPGETPFTIDAQIISNYNGFGVSCKDSCNAFVEVTVTGGIGPFTYQWVGGPSTAQWMSACGGTEIVIVTDVGQGIQCATSVLVIEPSALSVIIVPPGFTPPTCSGECDGQATLFAVGGAGLYTYDWNNGQASGNSVSNLCEGANTLQVDDQNGCSLDTTFTLVVDPIVPNEQFQDASCNGNCDGTIWLNVSGGQPGYTYVWTPAPPFGQGTDSIAGLCAGNYDVLITDANNCDTTISFTITEPIPISVSSNVQDALCWNSCDGEVSVTPSGAVGPFTYDWTPDPTNGDGTNIGQGFCPGPVTVLITDQASGCDTLVQFTVGSPPVLDPQLTITDASCAQVCDGTASLTPVGGTAGYSFLWTPTPGNGQGTGNATGLCAGSYTVLITDAQNCDTLVSFDILEPSPIDPVPTFTDINCHGDCDGTASVSPVGGTPGYTYTWTPPPPFGQGTDSVAGLCAGLWTVLVSDVNGCDTLVEITITEPDSIIATLDVQDATCEGSCNGSATVVVSGGTAPYSYNWIPAPAVGQGTDQVSGLCAGSYTLEVSDAFNCLSSIPFTILEPSGFNVQIAVTDPSCGSVCDGTAALQVSGSNGSVNADYTFNWTPAPVAGQGTASASGICLGTYDILITDSLGCDTTVSFSITTPPLLLPNETVTNASCFGDCDGSIALNPAGGIGALTILWNPVPPGGQGILNATGLCAGNWMVTISDTTGCDTTLSIDITQPSPFTITPNQSDATCWDVCDGAAGVIVSGNSGPFTFAWNPSPGNVISNDSVATATGLCGGLYDLTITDSFGCDSIFQFTILEPDSITNLSTVTNVSCNDTCDGAIDLTSSGGAGMLSYSWTPAPPVGDGTPNISGLCEGPYTVVISDANNCSTTETFTIGPASPFVIQLNVTDPSCGVNCDGSAQALVSGGAGGYTYLWNPAPTNGQGTDMASGICLGAYDLTVTDVAGCDTTVSFTITTPDSILANPVIQDASCFGECDGSIALNPFGGVGGLSVTWSPIPPSGVSDPNATGLCAGIWNALITDATGCDTTLSFTINEPIAIDVQATAQNPSCAGDCNGQIDLVVNGVVPFTFAWTPQPPTGDGTANVSDLCAGQWTVLITDGNGCDSTMVFDLIDPQPINATLTTTPSACGGACIGTASVVVTGGTGPLTYLWSPGVIIGQGTPNVSDLCSGAYSVVISDSLGCDTTLNFTISSPSGIVAIPSVIDATCNALCDGTISLAVTGGAPPLTYTWTPTPPVGDGTPNVSGLCPGIYSVLIGDQAGCDTTLLIPVGSATQIQPNESVTQVDCNGDCNGSISFAPMGGSPGYTYTWTPAPPNGQGSSSGTSLCAGSYTIVIADANGCDTTLNITISEPPAFDITLSTTLSSCAICSGTASVDVLGASPGYGYAWFDNTGAQIGTADSISMLCAGAYSVLIQDALACDTTISFIISDSNGEILTSSVSAAACSDSCNGSATVNFTCSDPPCTIDWLDDTNTSIGQSANTANQLCPGEYYAVVTNASGCVSVDTVNVDAPAPFVALLSSSDVDCAGLCNGSALVTVSGNPGPFNYLWTPSPLQGQGTSFAQGFCAGAYVVNVSDPGGCDTNITFTIAEPLPLNVQGLVDDEICAGSCDGQIALTVNGGTAPYTFQWSPSPTIGQGTPIASGLCPGNYSVLVFDANNCSEQLSFTVLSASQITFSSQTTTTSCGQCTGTAQISASGGSGPLSYVWLDQAGVQVSNTSSANFLCAGVYNVTITDSLLCDTSLAISISDAQGEQLTVSSSSPSCLNACDGSAAVLFVCSDPPCQIDWTDANGVSIGVTSDTLSPVCAGNYFVAVTNGSNCITIELVTVLPADGIVPTVQLSPSSCIGDCDGTASVSLTGGQGPFTYTWSPAPGGGQGTPNATGLCETVYTCLVMDANGCDTTLTITMPTLTDISVVSTVVQNDCSRDCNASISLTPQGGTAPYTYQWSPIPSNGQGSFEATGLCAGVYQVTVFDANNCDTTLNFTISDPLPLDVSVTTTNSTCGNADGTATALVSGGTGTYGFSWTDQNGLSVGAANVASGLSAGIYNLTVSDSLGCDTSLTVFITDLNGETLSTSFNSPSCSDTCDGSATVTFICNDPPCTIDWYDAVGNPIGQNTNSATQLCADLYFVSVTNGLGCISIDSVDIAPPIIGSVAIASSDVSCFSSCDGTASVTITGAAQPLTYLWSPTPGAGQGSDQVSGLCAGTYTVLVTDGLGCDTTVNVLILGPNQLIPIAQVSDASCNGACDGSIVLAPIGGTAPYSYNWSPAPPNGQGNNQATQLCAGSYDVTLTDGNGCDTTIIFVISEPSAISIGLTATQNIACFGDCIGVASAVVNGGTPPYSFTWTDSTGTVIALDTLDVSALCGGSYTFSVQDSSGCVRDTTFSISQGAPIVTNLNFTNEGCTMPCDAYATVNPSGGDGGPYTVTWFPQPAFIGPDSAYGFCVGTYSVTITDGLGCDTVEQFTVGTAIPITAAANAVNVSCNGLGDGYVSLNVTGGTGVYSYQWTPPPPFGQGTDSVSGLAPGPISVLISDSLGCDTTLSFNITEPTVLQVTLDQILSPQCVSVNDGIISVSASGGSVPYVYQWTGPNGFVAFSDSISQLFPGQYTVTVLDDANCQTSLTIQLDPVLQLIADAGPDTSVCVGDDVILDGSSSIGGIDFDWADLSGTPLGADDSLALNMTVPGTFTYVLTVRNGPLCFEIDTVVVTVFDLPNADAGPDQVIYDPDDPVFLGGDPTAAAGNSVLWVPDSLLNDPSLFDPVFAPGQTTWFVVFVTDSNGCVASDSVLIEIFPEVTVPSGFTPNGDGFNDIWQLDITSLFPQLTVDIFNRWGEPLFNSVGYNVPWDGRYDGKPLPVGTYYYVIELNDPNFPEPLTGPVTILR